LIVPNSVAGIAA